jgi:hypothetical protein
MSRFRFAVLAVLMVCGTSLGAQMTGDRVRIQLIGLRIVDDTVVRWSGDSLLLLRNSTVRRSEIMHMSRRRAAPAFGTWLRGTSTSLMLTMPLALRRVEGDDGRRHLAMSPQQHLTLSAGLGLGWLAFSRITHRERWVPVMSAPRF